ncbi:erythropoietin receptor isoform X2 [Brienomyrus brachyistius]|uniref:erythropoietin receptor isoform X2 n=1 Tax=Brienomyrus brachyistius TaxID=42636 RepID=UPI0020B3D0D8|nr:erythropoietin receptor isoform X2 [Brienomyrus brachyistius]
MQGARLKMTILRKSQHFGLLIFFLSQKASLETVDRHFESKVDLLLNVETENPKCFAEGMRDLTCFWEEEDGGTADQYTFTYKYENEKSSECKVTSQPAEGAKTRYFCHLPKVQHFGDLYLCVFRDGLQVYNRSLLINLNFWLDPPANLTVTQTGKLGQLKVTWLPPPLKYMESSMMYEVRYTTGSSWKEKVIHESTEITLQGLQVNTKYKVQVRVKPDGLTYDGFWSSWTLPVSMTTAPKDMDPLILALCLIITFILILLSLTALMSHRSSLQKKMWPLIPSPENKFPGLFTVYGGDFQEWLGHSGGGLRPSPAFFSFEELPAMLEVLSEATPVPPRTVESRACNLPESGCKENEEDLQKAESEQEGWQPTPPGHWLMKHFQPLQQGPSPFSWSTQLESKDSYVTLDHSFQPKTQETPMDDISEESAPLRVLFTSAGISASHSDLGSLPQSCRSGRLSSESSFEYPHSTWPPKGITYASVTLADSGVSVDYSPMDSIRTAVGGRGGFYNNDYKNETPKPNDLFSGSPIYSAC